MNLDEIGTAVIGLCSVVNLIVLALALQQGNGPLVGYSATMLSYTYLTFLNRTRRSKKSERERKKRLAELYPHDVLTRESNTNYNKEK